MAVSYIGGMKPNKTILLRQQAGLGLVLAGFANTLVLAPIVSVRFLLVIAYVLAYALFVGGISYVNFICYGSES